MMTDKALADTLELMAAEIAALKRQIGELQQRERVDSNSFSISTHNHSGTYLPLNANGVFEIGANDGVAGHALFDLHTSTTVRNYDARFGVYSGQTVFKIENLLGGGVDAAAPLMEAGQRVFSPNNPQYVPMNRVLVRTGAMTAGQTADINVSTAGIPSSARAVYASADFNSAVAGGTGMVEKGYTSNADLVIKTPVANVQNWAGGIVACNNGVIRVRSYHASSKFDVYITGFFL